MPETDRFVTPVIAPSISASPVNVRLLPPPSTVETVLIVDPVNVR